MTIDHDVFDVFIDASLDECPIPTIRTKDALDAMTDNQILKLVTSKEGTIRNIKTFVRNNHCELVDESGSKDRFVFYIKKLPGVF